MNLDWVIPCRYVEVHDNLGTIIGAGIDTFWLPELPQTITVVLAVRLLATPEELDENVQHTAINRVRDPSGELVSEVGGEFSVGGGDSARPDWLTGIILPSLVQIEVTEAGTYMIEHELDGSSKSLPIHVVQGLPAGMDHPEGE